MALRDSAIVFLTGWAAFALCSWLTGRYDSGPVGHQLALKSLLAVAAFGLIALWRRRVPGSYGFERSQGVRWARVCGTGLLMGAVSSLLVLLLGGRGLQSVFGSMKFYQIVLVIWFGSSVSEEIFTRGWAQGALDRWRDVRVGSFSVPVLTGAVLFGSMHLSLFARGIDPVTATVIVIAATCLGFFAGVLRERHRGIAPAIAVHVCFNAGGVIGGMMYVISYRLRTGHLPFQS